MKIYLLNGRKVWLDENNLPNGAEPCETKKVEKKAEMRAWNKAKPKVWPRA